MTGDKTSEAAGKGRPPYSREQILAAAVALLDEVGLARFTVRELASRLSCTDMTIYHHLGSHEGLLDGMIEHLLGSVELPAAKEGESWEEGLSSLNRSLWALFRAHPQALPALLVRPLTHPAIVACFTSSRELLVAEGYDETDASEMLQTLTAYAMGYMVLACGGFLTIDPEAPPARTVRERTRSRKRRGVSCPGLGEGVDWEQLERGFDAGLATQLEGLRARYKPQRSR